MKKIKKKLTIREELRKNSCSKCGKKRWKFKSISRGSSPGSAQKWWECRDCGHRKYVYKK